MYPEWVVELETDSQMSVGYRAEGTQPTLIVGVDRLAGRCDREPDWMLAPHLYVRFVQQLLDLKVEWIAGT